MGSGFSRSSEGTLRLPLTKEAQAQFSRKHTSRNQRGSRNPSHLLAGSGMTSQIGQNLVHVIIYCFTGLWLGLWACRQPFKISCGLLLPFVLGFPIRTFFVFRCFLQLHCHAFFHVWGNWVEVPRQKKVGGGTDACFNLLSVRDALRISLGWQQIKNMGLQWSQKGSTWHRVNPQGISEKDNGRNRTNYCNFLCLTYWSGHSSIFQSELCFS